MNDGAVCSSLMEGTLDGRKSWWCWYREHRKLREIVAGGLFGMDRLQVVLLLSSISYGICFESQDGNGGGVWQKAMEEMMVYSVDLIL